MAFNHIKRSYKDIIKIRAFEELILDLFTQNKLSGTTHTYIGQEATAASLMQYIKPDDIIFSNHRCHGHYLAYGGPEKSLLAEIMSKQSGLCEGRGGSQHIHYKNFYTNGIQGGIVPNAVGVAFANKLSESKSNTVVFLGDGTLGQGVIYESMNMASIYQCPILFVIEDNQYAMSTRRKDAIAGDIRARIEGFGIESFEIESTDVDALSEFFSDIFKKLDTTRKPMCAVVHNYRLGAHSKGDDNRDPQEVAIHKAQDPMLILENLIGKETVEEIYDAYRLDFENIVAALEDEPNICILPESLSAPSAQGTQLASQKERYVELIRSAFDDELEKNQNIVFLGEDIKDPYGGPFKVTKGLSDKYPTQLYNTPISEAAMVGICVGMAMNGKLPVAEMMFGDFITLGFDQLLNHATKYAWVYGGSTKVPMIVRVPGGAKRGYGPTHSQSLEKYLIGIPLLRVISLCALQNPKTVYETLFSTIKEPTVVIENKMLYGAKTLVTADGKHKDFIVTEHNNHGYSTFHLTFDADSRADIYVMCYGGMVEDVLEASDALMLEEETLVDVVVLSQLSPLPTQDLKAIIPSDAKLMVVEEGTKTAGIGAEIIASCVEHSIGSSYSRVATPDIPIPNGIVLESQIIPDKEKIKAEIKKVLG